MLDPRWYLGGWNAAGRDATVAAASSMAVVLFSRLLWATAAHGQGEVPRLWEEVASTLATFSLFLVPQLAGLLVRAHAEALGFQLEHRGQRLAWPGAIPRHRRTLTPGSVRPESPRTREALELDLSGTDGSLVLEPLAGGGEGDPTS